MLGCSSHQHTQPTQNPTRAESTTTQQTTRCGGGLGDAPVSQRGAWGETPQILTLLTQRLSNPLKSPKKANTTPPKIQREPNQPQPNKQPVAEGVWGTRPSPNGGLGGRPPNSSYSPPKDIEIITQPPKNSNTTPPKI
jgi:hypothetical protein